MLRCIFEVEAGPQKRLRLPAKSKRDEAKRPLGFERVAGKRRKSI